MGPGRRVFFEVHFERNGRRWDVLLVIELLGPPIRTDAAEHQAVPLIGRVTMGEWECKAARLVAP